ncbi:MAG TPA: carbon-nitrogen hydrolase family protein [Bryobacteraceae bacterium]|nr:carbon-nitrogen hydrolase family protein [Bryobacteraceae bacterium]
MNLTIAAAQTASIPGDIAANAAHHLAVARLAEGADLLIFPELSLTGYELDLASANPITTAHPALEPLRQCARESACTIVAGGPLPGPNGELYIGAFICHPSGEITTYAKVHVHSSERHVFTPGPGGPPLHIKGVQIALAICADATFPEHAAAAAQAGARLYAVGAMIDDAGYARKSKLLETYAQQHGIAVLLANYSGVTGGEVSAGKSHFWANGTSAGVEGTEECLLIVSGSTVSVKPVPRTTHLP